MYEHVESGKLTPEQIDSYLDQPLLARMATASATTAQPHVVPVWYLWDGQSIWVHGYSGTRKFKELAGNPACSIIVDHATSGVDFWAVLLEGQAELITDSAVVVPMAERIYARYIGVCAPVVDPRRRELAAESDASARRRLVFCLPSTSLVDGGVRSSIVPALAGSLNRRDLAVNAAGSRNRLEQNTLGQLTPDCTRTIWKIVRVGPNAAANWQHAVRAVRRPLRA